jgi:hypothetical protein
MNSLLDPWRWHREVVPKRRFTFLNVPEEGRSIVQGGASLNSRNFFSFYLTTNLVNERSRDISVGITTRYGLDGSGIESRWRRDFPPPVQTGCDAHPSTYMSTWSFPGVKHPGRDVNHPPLSSAKVKERVGLYLYSPSVPSWPVLGRTLPLPLINAIIQRQIRGSKWIMNWLRRGWKLSWPKLRWSKSLKLGNGIGEAGEPVKSFEPSTSQM